MKEERKREREQVVKAWRILDPEGKESLQVDNPKFYYILAKLKPNVSCIVTVPIPIYMAVKSEGDSHIHVLFSLHTEMS